MKVNNMNTKLLEIMSNSIAFINSYNKANKTLSIIRAVTVISAVAALLLNTYGILRSN